MNSTIRLLIGTLAAIGPASAATLSWSAATNVSSAADVLTTGTLVQAVNYGTTTSYAINGVTFTGSTTGVFGGSAFNNAFTGYGQPSTVTGNYAAALSSGNYQNGSGVFSGTLSGLVIGQQYVFQVWLNDQRDTTADTMTYDSGSSTPQVTLTTTLTGSQAQYTVGTFTADAVTQAFRMTPTGGGGATMNLFQLRAVPEPATYGLLGAGALTSVVGVRRRRRAR